MEEGSLKLAAVAGSCLALLSFPRCEVIHLTQEQVKKRNRGWWGWGWGCFLIRPPKTRSEHARTPLILGLSEGKGGQVGKGWRAGNHPAESRVGQRLVCVPSTGQNQHTLFVE